MKKNIFLFFCLNIYSREELNYKTALYNFYHNRIVLVTGGCGFIGSHLAEALVELGAKVIIIDDLSAGKIDNIAQFKDKIIFIDQNIVERDMYTDQINGVSVIFHLAAFKSVPKSLKYPYDCHKSNIEGTICLLEEARLKNITRFIFSSSSSVYGIYTTKASEDMLCSPQSIYGCSKLIGELFCKQYSKNFGINTVGLRYFNVYGKRQDCLGEYAAFAAKIQYLMKHDLPITIHGDGLQKRDFTHVSKVVEANLISGMLAEKISGEIYNVGMGQSISLLDLIKDTQKKFPLYNAPLIFSEKRIGDVNYSEANCSKYNQLLEKLDKDISSAGKSFQE